MCGGKTSMLMSYLERYNLQSRRIYVFKPRLDDRYDGCDIVTHNGLRWPATVVTSADDIVQHLADASAEKPDVVAVDEAFMLEDVTDTLVWLYKQGVTILVSTLDMSSRGVPFPETAKMLCWATQVHKRSAVCVVCGADAYFTHRKTDEIGDTEIKVGGLDAYEPRCMACHPLLSDG